jgi:hypothetical protein
LGVPDDTLGVLLQLTHNKTSRVLELPELADMITNGAQGLKIAPPLIELEPIFKKVQGPHLQLDFNSCCLKNRQGETRELTKSDIQDLAILSCGERGISATVTDAAQGMTLSLFEIE